MSLYPQLGLIDIGANIGTYTMFIAAMNRLVIAIECFPPNYMRIAKAIQIENLKNKVILIGNAVYSSTGQYIKLSQDSGNIGGQSIYGTTFNLTKSADDIYMVRTIRLDDILPKIQQTKISSFVMKIDIESAEYYVFESGKELFDSLDIPLIMMEWDKMHYNIERGNFVLRFLKTRKYIPITDTCQELNETEVFSKWPANVFWTKMNRTSIC
ncbi:unnamed protein product [Adineta steineri]|uniref:Methyltransferase FkbM domain-containing protein n=1 Tax=Adineta steineri TaxID=433720 RepID=A0A815IMR1_9BILA|nr:unnamed protein product [Adineta steineri]CAF1368058.1 unnamed protein product [Adineta steineri]CAF1413883.1 unnamed protein product [Adineta steineri]CAF3967086.1 unnamed protein product [Adineta steineri]CAF3983663.1 unnamed protein product [Adineta steineri]